MTFEQSSDTAVRLSERDQLTLSPMTCQQKNVNIGRFKTPEQMVASEEKD